MTEHSQRSQTPALLFNLRSENKEGSREVKRRTKRNQRAWDGGHDDMKQRRTAKEEEDRRENGAVVKEMKHGEMLSCLLLSDDEHRDLYPYCSRSWLLHGSRAIARPPSHALWGMALPITTSSHYRLKQLKQMRPLTLRYSTVGIVCTFT